MTPESCASIFPDTVAKTLWNRSRGMSGSENSMRADSHSSSRTTPHQESAATSIRLWAGKLPRQSRAKQSLRLADEAAGQVPADRVQKHPAGPAQAPAKVLAGDERRVPALRVRVEARNAKPVSAVRELRAGRQHR